MLLSYTFHYNNSLFSIAHIVGVLNLFISCSHDFVVDFEQNMLHRSVFSLHKMLAATCCFHTLFTITTLYSGLWPSFSIAHIQGVLNLFMSCTVKILSLSLNKICYMEAFFHFIKCCQQHVAFTYFSL